MASGSRGAIEATLDRELAWLFSPESRSALLIAYDAPPMVLAAAL